MVMNDVKNKQVIKVYNKIAPHYANEFDSNPDAKFLNIFIKHLNGKKVLDIGCGTGKQTKFLHDYGFNVEGIDLSSGMLKIAKQKYPNIKFKKADVRNLKHKTNSIDGIWAGFVLFHINRKDFIKTIKGIQKILKPKGVFALAMQEGKGDVVFDEPLLPKEKIYLWLYTKRELKKILSQNGFKVIDEAIRKPQKATEFPFNKLFLVAQKV